MRISCPLLQNLAKAPSTLSQRKKFFWNSVEILQMSSIHTLPEKFKNATEASYFGFGFEEDSGREITWLCFRHPWLVRATSLLNSLHVGDLSAGTGKLCILGHLGLVFIWSCIVSCVLFLLFYISLRNLCSGTCRKIPGRDIAGSCPTNSSHFA